MACPGCGSAVDSDARFCAECGAPQAGSCEECGAELVVGAKFCSACGTAVRDTPSDRAGIERKTISALFVDLAGFTASAVDADPEDVAQQLNAFHATVRSEVEQHGGRVEKLIGDGVFAVFGAPMAHEDDPQRAVRAALGIQEAVSRLTRSQALELAARVAVTTGEAVVRLDGTAEDREGIVGDVVNLASRLEALAPIGGVLVDQPTHDATSRLTEYLAQEPVSVKGQPEPLTTFVATGLMTDSAPPTEDLAFVGRREALDRLSDYHRRSIENNATELVTIIGEPGVGKTRLATEFRRSLDDGSNRSLWLQGRCPPYGDGISFWALAEIVKSHTGVQEGEPTAEVSRKIGASLASLFPDDSDRSWMEQRLLELMGTTAGTSTRQERFAAWSEFFRRVAGNQPLVLLFEDVHWADTSLIAFLDHLVGDARAPILIVATARPELLDTHGDWATESERRSIVELNPLSPHETTRLLEHLEGDERVVSWAVERSGGNPLHAAELVRMAQEHDTTDEAVVPATVHAVLASRIDLSPPTDKQVLHAASVIGKTFGAGAVAFASGLGPETVEESLDRLTRRQLLVRVGDTSTDHDRGHAFSHDLAVEVAYGQIGRERRRALHRAAAAWLESRAGDRVGELSEVLAHHYTTALDLTRALGETDPDLALDARRNLIGAGRRASHVDPGRARSFLDRALALSQTPSQRAEALTSIAHVAMNVGGVAEAIEIGHQAVEEAEAGGDRAAEAQAAIALARPLWAAGDGTAARTATNRALALAADMSPGPDLATVLSRAVATLFLQGDFSSLDELMDRALEVSESHGRRVDYLEALKWAGALRAELGDVDEGVRLLREVHQGAIEGGYPSLHISSAASLATMLYSHGLGAQEARRICESAISAGHTRGLGGSADFLRVALCEILWITGQWQEIPPHANYMVETYGMDSHAGIGGNVWLSRYLVFTMNPDQRLSESMLALGRQSGDHQFLVPELIESIVRLRQADDRDSALRLVDEFEEATADRPFFRVQYLFYVALFLEEIEAWDVLARLIDGTGTEPDDPRLAYSRAVLARGRGHLGDAVDHLSVATNHARQLESPWREALAVVQQAAVDVDRGNTADAERALARAEELLASIGPSVFDGALSSVRQRL